MIQLDTIKVCVPECSVEYFDESYFNINPFIDGKTGELKRRTYHLKDEYRLMGVTKLDVIQGGKGEEKKVVCEISAKILREEYFDLINKNTIEKVIEELNEVPAIKFNKHLLLDKATLYRCDCTNNIIVESETQDYIDALNIYRNTRKFRVERYPNGGLVFTKKVTKGSRFRERITVYPKYNEVIRDKELLKYINPDDFKHVLRFESNFTTFIMMRKVFSIGKTQNKSSQLSSNFDTSHMVKLIDVLESKENPNLYLFNKIVKEYPAMMKEHDEMKLHEIEKLEGRKNIIEKCNYDPVIIKTFINSKVKGNISGYLRDYKALMLEVLKEQEEGKGIESDGLLDELREKLKTA